MLVEIFNESILKTNDSSIKLLGFVQNRACMKKYLVIIFLFIFALQGLYAQYSIQDIQNPKHKGQNYYVSNPDRILSSSAEHQLNLLSHTTSQSSGAEFAIVIVNNYEGDDDFEFALKLFNTWGIGKKESNNGLLLFIAKDRRQYRFISGYGMERIFPDAFLKRVGEKYLVPNFRSQDYNTGVLEAATFIHHILLSPNSIAELEAMMPEAISFWSFRSVYFQNSLLVLLFYLALYLYTHTVINTILKRKKAKSGRYASILWGLGLMAFLMFVSLFFFLFLFNNLTEVYRKENVPYFILVFCLLVISAKLLDGYFLINKHFVEDEEKDNTSKSYLKWMLIPMLLSPIAWIVFYKINKRIINNRGRFLPPDDSGHWKRTIRKNPKIGREFLSDGQQMEEKIKSRKYEIWKNLSDNSFKIIPWDINGKFKECPSCHFYTLLVNASMTTIEPTYTKNGEWQKLDKCQYCSYKNVKGTFSIGKKVKTSPSSSGGGSSWSGGSSSSSSSSGSFGGGSSGGGGAGGRW